MSNSINPLLETLSPKLKILLVDDSDITRQVARKVLRNIGFTNIVECKDGAEAYNQLSLNDFEIVIADWHMPNITGLDLLKKIRAGNRLKDVPFLMVTSEDKMEFVMQAIKAGVSSYIVKPVTVDSMETKLAEIFSKTAS